MKRTYFHRILTEKIFLFLFRQQIFTSSLQSSCLIILIPILIWLDHDEVNCQTKLPPGYYAFETGSRKHGSPPRVLPPPYHPSDTVCPGESFLSSSSRVTRFLNHDFCTFFLFSFLSQGVSANGFMYSPRDTLCGDLNKAYVPRNPLGQAIHNQPYPLWVTGRTSRQIKWFSRLNRSGNLFWLTKFSSCLCITVNWSKTRHCTSWQNHFLSSRMTLTPYPKWSSCRNPNINGIHRLVNQVIHSPHLITITHMWKRGRLGNRRQAVEQQQQEHPSGNGDQERLNCLATIGTWRKLDKKRANRRTDCKSCDQHSFTVFSVFISNLNYLYIYVCLSLFLSVSHSLLPHLIASEKKLLLLPSLEIPLFDPCLMFHGLIDMRELHFLFLVLLHHPLPSSPFFSLIECVNLSTHWTETGFWVRRHK